jgi:serine/threonine protein kinase
MDVLTYLQQVMSGLSYLHAKGLIHLDVKPENVILESKSNSIRLIDFGCAQLIQPRFADNLPTRGYYENTEFLAPELISNGPVGTYTDMWAYGVLLYVALRLIAMMQFYY